MTVYKKRVNMEFRLHPKKHAQTELESCLKEVQKDNCYVSESLKQDL